jgi:hypothetical protein
VAALSETFESIELEADDHRREEKTENTVEENFSLKMK